jgi:carbon starvation protein
MAAGQVPADKLAQTQTLIFNNRLDAAVCLVFVLMVAVIVIDSVRVWAGILKGTREARSYETPFVASQLKPEEI